MPTARPPIQILLVEDNPADIRLTVEAFKEARVENRLHVARDGAEAMTILKSEEAGHFVPDLVVLDLNLPKKHGLEVLSEMRMESRLRHIPVLILTTSRADRDILQSYDLGANAVITKPVDLDQFLELVKSIERFWMAHAHLPRL